VRDFKIEAINSGISPKVVDQIMSNAKFLPKVIEYDRYQPEFMKILLLILKKDRPKIRLSRD
jgi:membrane-bound lytic murein transglycosylase B